MRLVKFQHTIFAMPFALMAFAYAMWKYALAEICPVPLTGASVPRIPARPVGRFPPA